MTRSVCRVALALAISGVAAAQEPPPHDDGQRPDPHDGAPTWGTPPPRVQAQQDPSVPPAATGAIFVPAMEEVGRERSYIVRHPGSDEPLVETPAGRKTWLTPGTYHVLVGSGVPANRMKFEVVVVEGRTTFVPVEWGGLIVDVVNERGTPFRGSYELVQLPARQLVGLGLGANVAEGEQVSAWSLRPGLYMLLAAGESYRARKNFATLRLPAGALVRYTLVLDESTGEMLGAGEVDYGTTGTEGGPWSVSLILGGSLQFNRADAVVGKPEGMSLDISGFLETIGGYRDESHLAYARLYIEEEGQLALPDEPYLSVVDELDIDVLYMWRFLRWFGPYGRISMETQLVPGVQDFELPTTVRTFGSDGEQLAEERDLTHFDLSPAFSPIDLRYGAGVRFDVAPAYWFQMNARAGLAARHLFTRGLFVAADDTSTDELEFNRTEDKHQFGAEASMIAELRITRWVQLKVEFDFFEPFDDLERPVVDLRTTVALRLASFASLNYTLRVQKDPGLTDDTQIDQAVLLRFAYKIL